MNMINEFDFIKTASSEEMDYYLHKLYPVQDRVMENIKSKAFYLTGGTALSRFYYNHRFSDDLDFFYDGFRFPRENFTLDYRQTAYALENAFDRVEVTIDGDNFKRLLVSHGKVSLKIEFVFENFKTVGDMIERNTVQVDSKENICANKMCTITDRRTARDFFDLYYLLRDIKLQQAMKWSQLKMVPPDYEGILMAIGDLLQNHGQLEGEIRAVKPVDAEDFYRFVKQLVGELLDHAKRQSG